MALENGEPVARLVARASPSLKDEAGRPYGMLGFFEALPDQDEVVLLIPQGLHERSKILSSLELMATKVMPRFA